MTENIFKWPKKLWTNRSNDWEPNYLRWCSLVGCCDTKL